MKKLWLWMVASALWAFEPSFTTIDHPFRLMFYAPFAQSCSHDDHLEMAWSESNDYEDHKDVLLDMEIATLRARITHLLGDETSGWMEWGVHYVYGGFLDRPLDTFHDLTHTLGNRIHNAYGVNHVNYRLGSFLAKDHPYVTPANLQLGIKHTVWWQETQWGVMGGVKLPTAPKKDGFGSGKPDFMMGLIIEHDPWLLNLQAIRAGKSDIGNLARSRRWIYSLYLGFSYHDWLLELRSITSPFRSGKKVLDSCSNVINLAYNITNDLQIFATENLAPFFGSADFTVGMSYRF